MIKLIKERYRSNVEYRNSVHFSLFVVVLVWLVVSGGITLGALTEGYYKIACYTGFLTVVLSFILVFIPEVEDIWR